MKAAAGGALKGMLAYSDGPLVSVDFNHDPALVDLRRDADQGDRRHAGQGVRLVRQRVGFLEPHARYHRRLGERELTLRTSMGTMAVAVLRMADLELRASAC